MGILRGTRSKIKKLLGRGSAESKFKAPDSNFEFERVVDPDSETSSLCCACRQPIFSTPSIYIPHGSDKLLLHEQCNSLPHEHLHELHPHQPLVLINQPDDTSFTCHNCNETCGTSYYHCPDSSCNFRLDLLCVLQLKIKHKSHNHALTVIRQRESSSLTCGSCNTKHDSESERPTISYLCNLCGYWIHPDCAFLPNAVHYNLHEHYLYLNYKFPTPYFSICFICSEAHKGSFGAFACLRCTDRIVHISCALRNPQSFQKLLMRDANAHDLGRLPMEDEQTSLIPYIREGICATDGYHPSRFHKHPLIFHKNDDGNQYSWRRICNACTQYVSPPFYSCSECPDFYLHDCCAHLPIQIEHRAHGKHNLWLYRKAPNSDSISAGFSCKGCHLWCNGFAYSCEICDDFNLDVVCALITPAITHAPHKSNHFLYMSPTTEFSSDEKCSCCSSTLTGICYSCTSCSDFKLHVRCALLPLTVRHIFDPHPLLLTTAAPGELKGGCSSSQDEFFCEVCEENLEGEGPRRWHYSCEECDQWFHYDCIPSIDRLSRIKVGADARVDVHGCSVSLVRLDDGVCAGRRCGACGEKLKLGDDGLVYECSNCFFGLHQHCAKKHLLQNDE